MFLHLTGVDERVIAQYDGQPLAGRFPTSLWRADDRLTDTIELPLARAFDPEHTHLWLGMYQLATLQRLIISDAQGQRLADDRIPIR